MGRRQRTSRKPLLRLVAEGTLSIAVGLGVGAGCGARTGLPVWDGPADDASIDGPPEVVDVAGRAKATRIRGARVGSVDLLLVVDNSISMADKQSELGRRIPQLIKALTNPDVDPSTGKPRTPPVADLHVGVVTTSLGSHGTSACRPRSSRHNDDHGHLLPREGEAAAGNGYYVDTDAGEPRSATCPTPIAATPIRWVFDPARDPTAPFRGPEQSAALQTSVSCVVQSVKDDGCGFEETLESMYHFLIDPAPWGSADATCKLGTTADECTGSMSPTGVDTTILAQRKAFLRKDSLLAIIILSDENDASLRPYGRSWQPWALGTGTMPRAFTRCEDVPDDFEPETAEEIAQLHDKWGCWSCEDRGTDGNCLRAWPTGMPYDNDIDSGNLRAFQQVQRFGRNFLWARRRYVDGLSKPTVPGADGKPVANPVFEGGMRTPDLVVVAGIVGVPKGLVTDSTGALRTLSDADWERIASSDPTRRDPHMIESIAPRTSFGLPLYGGDPKVDPVNGGDRHVQDGTDLQYACIAPRASTTATLPCLARDAWKTNPLCAPDGTQPRFKAYPGLRQLRVLRDLGPSGIAASICDASFAPAIQGIAERLQRVVSGQCLFSVFEPAAAGDIPCVAFETFSEDTVSGKASCAALGAGYCTPGAAPCRAYGTAHPPLSAAEAASRILLPVSVASGAKLEELPPFESAGNVYVMGSDGKRRLVCETLQLGAPRTDATTARACREDASFALPAGAGGWCYSRSPDVVSAQCLRGGAIGQLRFLGDVRPKAGSDLSVLCGGA